MRRGGQFDEIPACGAEKRGRKEGGFDFSFCVRRSPFVVVVVATTRTRDDYTYIMIDVRDKQVGEESAVGDRGGREAKKTKKAKDLKTVEPIAANLTLITTSIGSNEARGKPQGACHSTQLVWDVNRVLATRSVRRID